MIQWPSRAFSAVRKLFEPLQDIDVYVEDKNDEVFYTNLLKRIASDRIKIARVFSLGGRRAVIDGANLYAINKDPNKRRSLFIIDGDLEWVMDDAPPSNVACLHRLDAYCIENYLICEMASAIVLMQEMVIAEDEAVKRLDFNNWSNSLHEPLIKLFCAFAVVNKYLPTYQTVSRGVGVLCSTQGGGAKTPQLDFVKVQNLTNAALLEAERHASKAVVENLYNQIYLRALSLVRPLDIVSGKDFLLPLLDFLLQSHGCRVRRGALRFRLALACKVDRFEQLFIAMEQAARGAR